MEQQLQSIQISINKLIEEKQLHDKVELQKETKNITNLGKLVEKSNKYTNCDWLKPYGIGNTNKKIKCLYQIILEQNKRIWKLEQQLQKSNNN